MGAYGGLHTATEGLVHAIDTDHWYSNTGGVDLVDITNNQVGATVSGGGVTYDSEGVLYDGLNHNIREQWNSSYNIDDNTTPRSWEVVVKANVSTSNEQVIYGHRASDTNTFCANGGIVIEGGFWRFNWYDNSAYQYIGNYPVALNEYVHIVGTMDSDSIPRIYINGELNDTYGSVTSMNYASGMIRYSIAGQNRTDLYKRFGGYIPIIRFYHGKALSLQEAKLNYEAYKTRFKI